MSKPKTRKFVVKRRRGFTADISKFNYTMPPAKISIEQIRTTSVRYGSEAPIYGVREVLPDGKLGGLMFSGRADRVQDWVVIQYASSLRNMAARLIRGACKLTNRVLNRQDRIWAKGGSFCSPVLPYLFVPVEYDKQRDDCLWNVYLTADPELPLYREKLSRGDLIDFLIRDNFDIFETKLNESAAEWFGDTSRVSGPLGRMRLYLKGAKGNEQ